MEEEEEVEKDKMEMVGGVGNDTHRIKFMKKFLIVSDSLHASVKNIKDYIFCTPILSIPFVLQFVLKPCTSFYLQLPFFSLPFITSEESRFPLRRSSTREKGGETSKSLTCAKLSGDTMAVYRPMQRSKQRERASESERV